MKPQTVWRLRTGHGHGGHDLKLTRGPGEVTVAEGSQGAVFGAGDSGLGDELATVNPLVDGGQRNLGLTSDSSQFVCHRIECAQRV